MRPVRTRIAIGVVAALLLIIVPASAGGAETQQAEPASTPRQLTTGWLAPTIDLGGLGQDVCRVDISFSDNESGEDLSGQMTLYLGRPRYDLFGEPVEEDWQELKVEIKLAPRDPNAHRRSALGWRSRSAIDNRKNFTITAGSASHPELSLIVSDTLSFDSRLILHEKRLSVLALWSPRDAARSAELGFKSEGNLAFASHVFPTADNRWSHYYLRGDESNFHVQDDQNNVSLSDLGDVVATTAVSFLGQKGTVERIDIPDDHGERELYRITSRVFNPHVGVLVRHPELGGPHRLLIVNKDDEVVRIVAMHSRTLRAWLRAKDSVARCSDEAQRAFEKLSERIPLYAGFSIKDDRVVRASFHGLDESNEDILEEVCDLPHLERLELRQSDVSGSYLHRLNQIQTLRLASCEVDAQLFERVSRLPRLEYLDVYGSTFDCRGLRFLAGHKTLRHLRLVNGQATHGDRESIAALGKLPKLESLNLHAVEMAPGWCEGLPTTKTLKDVNFQEAAFGDVLRYAQRAPHAKFRIRSGEVDINAGRIVVPNETTDEHIRQIAKIEGIHTVRFSSGENVADSTLGILSEMNLVSLRISNAKRISNAGILLLARCPTLESLRLINCKNVTNRSINTFKTYPKLRELDVQGTDVNLGLLRAALPNCEIK